MRGKLRWKRSTAWLCLGAWLGLISAVATAAPASIFDLNQGAITYTVVVVGQLNYLDKYGGGGDTGRYIVLHRWMGIGTATIFTAAGLLAVLAPSPLPKPLRLDTAAVHKVAMTVAAAGMLAQIILGPFTASREGQLSQRDFALAHQIVGYTTLAATATGFAVLTF